MAILREAVSWRRIESGKRAAETTSPRRSARTNAFSKKVENLQQSVAITFRDYNFCRIHQTLRVTRAMAAGLTDHVWELADLIALMPKPVAKAWGSVKRGTAA
jgi:hypothetical protein